MRYRSEFVISFVRLTQLYQDVILLGRGLFLRSHLFLHLKLKLTSERLFER